MDRTRGGASVARIGSSREPEGHCWDNAGAEAFFGSIKKERVQKHIYKTRELAVADLADYIDTFYNPLRRHSRLGGGSPDQFETAHKSRGKGVH